MFFPEHFSKMCLKEKKKNLTEGLEGAAPAVSEEGRRGTAIDCLLCANTPPVVSHFNIILISNHTG